MMNTNKLQKFISIAIFGLPIFVIGSLSAFYSVYYMNQFERMWGKAISFQVSSWFINAYAISGILLYWLGITLKRSRQNKINVVNLYISVIFGLIQAGLLFLGPMLPTALFVIIFFFPVLLGMTASTYWQNKTNIEIKEDT